MQMQEIKTKMKHTSLAELNAVRSPEGGSKACWGDRLEKDHQIKYRLLGVLQKPAKSVLKTVVAYI